MAGRPAGHVAGRGTAAPFASPCPDGTPMGPTVGRAADDGCHPGEKGAGRCRADRRGTSLGSGTSSDGRVGSRAAAEPLRHRPRPPGTPPRDRPQSSVRRAVRRAMVRGPAAPGRRRRSREQSGELSDLARPATVPPGRRHRGEGRPRAVPRLVQQLRPAGAAERRVGDRLPERLHQRVDRPQLRPADRRRLPRGARLHDAGHVPRGARAVRRQDRRRRRARRRRRRGRGEDGRRPRRPAVAQHPPDRRPPARPPPPPPRPAGRPRSSATPTP